MSLFYRRSIQEMLQQCVDCASDDQLKELVNKLNREDAGSLTAQWELGCLFALSRLGAVTYELKVGQSKPDFLWKPNCVDHSILMDVRTVSDESLHEANPHGFWRHELDRRISNFGLNPKDFEDSTVGSLEGKPGNQKMKLLYPPRGEAKNLFGDKFKHFLGEIKRNDPEHHSVHLLGSNYDLTVIYRKSSRYRTSVYHSYTTYYSSTRNPIFRALNDKFIQLKKASFNGPTGIILADGGCTGLRTTMLGGGGLTYRMEDIASRFLRGTKSISFVMTIAVDRRPTTASRDGRENFTVRLFQNKTARNPIDDSIVSALREIPKLLPGPKMNGDNAARHLKKGLSGPQESDYADLKYDVLKHIVKVPARMLQDLMAGRINKDRFSGLSSIRGAGSNIFERLLAGGYIISATRLERLEHEDDDHLVLEFSQDVAASPYRVPEKKV